MARPEAPARPVYLNPFKVHLPVTATVSLAHRVSGVLLLAALPVVLEALQASLAGEAGWQRVAAALGGVPGRLALLVLTWALAHHLAAGVRHLLFDAGIGTRYAQARRSAWAVHAVALGLTGLAAAVSLARLA
ncbi:MAG TPA: succinate dehydrogenase, cytochrome b556 subunit [Burkholderiaceae bacterium]|nr:succinate dehydrogenase, cytochrome b556 subunit [Burkholderiaceae bacterium]